LAASHGSPFCIGRDRRRHRFSWSPGGRPRRHPEVLGPADAVRRRARLPRVLRQLRAVVATTRVRLAPQTFPFARNRNGGRGGSEGPRHRAKFQTGSARTLPHLLARFEDDDEVTPELVPTVGLDAYTLALELEVNGPGPSKRSLFVGTGRVDDASENDKAMYKFEVDEGIVAEVDDLDQPLRLRARIIATRRKGDRIQHAKLFCGQEEDGDPDFVYFGFQNLPNRKFRALYPSLLQNRHNQDWALMRFGMASDQLSPNFGVEFL